MSRRAPTGQTPRELGDVVVNVGIEQSTQIQLPAIRQCHANRPNRAVMLGTVGDAPLAHPLDLQNVFRPDEPGESLPRDAALSNAPDRRGDFFAVPAVLE